MLPGSVFSVTMRIRIRIRLNNADPTGSTTLYYCNIVNSQLELYTDGLAVLGVDLSYILKKGDCFNANLEMLAMKDHRAQYAVKVPYTTQG